MHGVTPSPQRKSDISDFRLVNNWPKSGRPDFGWGEGGGEGGPISEFVSPLTPTLSPKGEREFHRVWFTVIESHTFRSIADSSIEHLELQTPFSVSCAIFRRRSVRLFFVAGPGKHCAMSRFSKEMSR